MTLEEKKAYAKAYREKNREQIVANQRYWRKRNPEKVKAQAKKDNAKAYEKCKNDPERMAKRREATKRWQENHRDEWNAYCRERYHQKKLAERGRSMNGTICKSVMENCQNPYDSYGEICVGCNCCGRFCEDTVWQARYILAVERLQENILKLRDGYFQSNLQQKNICSNISYWSEKLQEALTHLDFDTEKGADNDSGKENA